jgi:hypothetical protein
MGGSSSSSPRVKLANVTADKTAWWMNILYLSSAL